MPLPDANRLSRERQEEMNDARRSGKHPGTTPVIEGGLERLGAALDQMR